VSYGFAVTDAIIDAPAPPTALRRVTQAFGEPSYRWWFASQLVSASGAMTQGVAQSWLVLQHTGRPDSLGLLTACTWLPVLLGGPWAGALVDRHDRRRILLATQAVLLLASLAQATISATGFALLPATFALAVITGAVSAVDAPARQVYVLELVGAARLTSAVSLFEVMLNASRVIGPATAGVLLVALGPTACFLVNAATFAAPLLVVLRSHPRFRSAAQEKTPAGVLDGLRYAWRTPVILACVGIGVAGGMLFNLAATLPPLATQTFHQGPGGYGAMMAAYGLGAIPGAVIAASRAAGPTARQARALASLSGLAVLLTAVSPWAIGGYLALALTGFLSIWLAAVANTLIQLRARPDMRGRTMALWNISVTGALPLTGPLTGLVAQHAGARAGFGLSGAALVFTALLAWRALGTDERTSTMAG